MSYQISLAQELEKKDRKLFQRLDGIRDVVTALLPYSVASFPTYTPHDFKHSESVEEILNDMIPDEVRVGLCGYEIFLLIVSAWLHDWGMISDGSEPSEIVRETHHLRTESLCEKHYDKVLLSEHEARLVGLISKGHRKIDLHTKEYDDRAIKNGNVVRVRLLAALVRMADECDVTHKRTPIAIYSSINPQGKSQEEFDKHLTISGAAFFSNKHKVTINGIAKTPKAATALRLLQKSIQDKLDDVVDILAYYGVPLEHVGLNIDARGFIDKPISFAVNKERIVDLLIGTHLYGYRDVAVRELVQNAIDACLLREAIDKQFKGRISITRISEDRIEISDNGIGMSFDEAKAFLSDIGTSYYGSGKYKEETNATSFQPISQYGIGILSCFLISDGIVIETQKANAKGCKFTIESPKDEWKYQEFQRDEPGTTITLTLNRHGKSIIVKDTLEKYLLCPDINIMYADLGETKRNFQNNWPEVPQLVRFIPDFTSGDRVRHDKVLEGSIAGATYILVKRWDTWRSGIVLFNHGIHVGRVEVPFFNSRHLLYVNITAPLVDLHISREAVVDNEKLRSFIYSLFKDIFISIEKAHIGSSDEVYFNLMDTLIERRYTQEFSDIDSFLAQNPFVRAFFDTALFPHYKDCKMSYKKLADCDNDTESVCYHSSHRNHIYDEPLISFCSSSKPMIINPYKVPKVQGKDGKYADIVQYYTFTYFKECTHLDFNDILAQTFQCVETVPDLPFVRFGTFKCQFKPLVVYSSYPCFRYNDHLGSAYYGSIELFKRLVDKNRHADFLDALNCNDTAFRFVVLEKEPIASVDISDPFISALLSSFKNIDRETVMYKKAKTYFEYLTFLPLVMANEHSLILFVEVLDTLEREIATLIKCPDFPPLAARLNPGFDFYVSYYTRHGIPCNTV